MKPSIKVLDADFLLNKSSVSSEKLSDNLLTSTDSQAISNSSSRKQESKPDQVSSLKNGGPLDDIGEAAENVPSQDTFSSQSPQKNPFMLQNPTLFAAPNKITFTNKHKLLDKLAPEFLDRGRKALHFFQEQNLFPLLNDANEEVGFLMPHNEIVLHSFDDWFPLWVQNQQAFNNWDSHHKNAFNEVLKALNRFLNKTSNSSGSKKVRNSSNSSTLYSPTLKSVKDKHVSNYKNEKPWYKLKKSRMNMDKI